MTEATRAALRIFISGRVQGVGYRAFAQREARRLGLVGWTRNRRDGRVECLARGEAAALESFLAALRRGPAAGEVTGVETTPAALAEAGAPDDFAVVETL
jgi:acylphosphatase